MEKSQEIELLGIGREGSDTDCTDGMCNEMMGLEHRGGYFRPYRSQDLKIKVKSSSIIVHKTSFQTNYLFVTKDREVYWESESDLFKNTEVTHPAIGTAICHKIPILLTTPTPKIAKLGNLINIDCVNVLQFKDRDYVVVVNGGSVRFKASIGVKPNGFVTFTPTQNVDEDWGSVENLKASRTAASEILKKIGSFEGACWMRYGVKDVASGGYIYLSTPTLVSNGSYKELEKWRKGLTYPITHKNPSLINESIYSHYRLLYADKIANDKLNDQHRSKNWKENDPQRAYCIGSGSASIDSIDDCYFKGELVDGYRVWIEERVRFHAGGGYKRNKLDYPDEEVYLRDIDDVGAGQQVIQHAGHMYQARMGTEDNPTTALYLKDKNNKYPESYNYAPDDIPYYSHWARGYEPDAEDSKDEKEFKPRTYRTIFTNAQIVVPVMKIYNGFTKEDEEFIEGVDILYTLPVGYHNEEGSTETLEYPNDSSPKSESEIKEGLNSNIWYKYTTIPIKTLVEMGSNQPGEIYLLYGDGNCRFDESSPIDATTILASERGLRYNISYLYNQRLHVVGEPYDSYMPVGRELFNCSGRTLLNDRINWQKFSRYFTDGVGVRPDRIKNYDEGYDNFSILFGDRYKGNSEEYIDRGDAKSRTIPSGQPFAFNSNTLSIEEIESVKTEEEAIRLYLRRKYGEDRMYPDGSFSVGEYYKLPFFTSANYVNKNGRFCEEVASIRREGHHSTSKSYKIEDTGSLIKNKIGNAYCFQIQRQRRDEIVGKMGIPQDSYLHEEVLYVVDLVKSSTDGESRKTYTSILSSSIYAEDLFMGIYLEGEYSTISIRNIIFSYGTKSRGGTYKIEGFKQIDCKWSKQFKIDKSKMICSWVNPDLEYVTFNDLVKETDDKSLREVLLKDVFSYCLREREDLRRDTFLVSDISSLSTFTKGVNEYQCGRGDIIGFASNSNDVSTGQFGDFPLYVFTTEGVFAFALNKTIKDLSVDPVYSYSSLVSRDVCVNANSIVETSQWVCFASSKGLMMLSGGSVTQLSFSVNGKPKNLPNEIAIEIGDGMHVYYRAITDNRLVDIDLNGNDIDFKDYICDQSTRLMYSYDIDKIIAYNSLYPYIYIIEIESATDIIVTKGVEQLSFDIENYPDNIVVVNDIEKETVEKKVDVEKKEIVTEETSRDILIKDDLIEAEFTLNTKEYQRGIYVEKELIVNDGTIDLTGISDNGIVVEVDDGMIISKVEVANKLELLLKLKMFPDSEYELGYNHTLINGEIAKDTAIYEMEHRTSYLLQDCIVSIQKSSGEEIWSYTLGSVGGDNTIVITNNTNIDSDDNETELSSKLIQRTDNDIFLGLGAGKYKIILQSGLRYSGDYDFFSTGNNGSLNPNATIPTKEQCRDLSLVDISIQPSLLFSIEYIKTYENTYMEEETIEVEEEVTVSKLHQFTYDGEENGSRVIFQTRAIKIVPDSMKSGIRIVLRGEFNISQDGESIGLYVFASNDTERWMYIGGSERRKTTAPIVDIGTTVERVSCKYIMIVFVGNLTRDSYIGHIEINNKMKYNLKLR